MKTWILIVLFGVLTACTGAPSTGGVAPSGGTEVPVTVEIPALDTSGSLAYVTGPVVSGGGSVAGMSKSVGAHAFKSVGMGGNPNKLHDSLPGCVNTNFVRAQIKVGSDNDLVQCVTQKNVVPLALQNSIDLYDGDYHDFRAKVAGEGTMDFRIKMVRNSQNVITDFEVFVCEGGQQTRYMTQKVSGTTNAIYGHGNALDGGRDVVTVAGTLNDKFQYLTKTIESAYGGSSGGVPFGEKVILIQTATTGNLDGFRTTERKEGAETEHLRSAFELGYSGDAASLPDPMKFFIGDGYGHYTLETIDVAECWNGDTLEPDPSSCGEFDDMVAEKPELPLGNLALGKISGAEAIDCASITPEVTFDLDLNGHVCEPFLVAHERIDCIAVTQGDFVATASVNGKVLSTSANDPTFIRAASTIVLTSNYAAAPDSFYAGSILIQPYTGSTEPDWKNQVSHGKPSWNSTYTQYTLSPALQSGTTYLLRVFGVDGSAKNSNVVGSAGVGGNKMKESRLYYFTVP